jgi:inner membrane protein
MAVGLIAAVLPDLDLIWFFLVDHRRHVHHGYLPHLPVAWVVTLALAAAVAGALRVGRTGWLLLGVFSANVMLHLVLDTTAGGVEWLWPWSDRELVMTEVPARYHPWYLNFLLHWTFALEITVLAAAALVWWRRRSRREFRPPSQ